MAACLSPCSVKPNTARTRSASARYAATSASRPPKPLALLGLAGRFILSTPGSSDGDVFPGRCRGFDLRQRYFDVDAFRDGHHHYLVFLVDLRHRAADAARSYHAIAFLDRGDHFLFAFLGALLRPDQQKVKDDHD
jgi:hypothetical protein